MEYNDEKILLTELAKRIKVLRKERGLTQEDCLNDTGISFSRIEMGSRDISFTTLHKICIYFKVSLKDFFSKGFSNLEN